MPRPRKKRIPTCPITPSTDGRWHGYLNVGRRGNGKPDIRHRSGKTEDECAAKILALEDELTIRKGRAPALGRSQPMPDYLNGWFADGCKERPGKKPRWAYKTRVDYRLVLNDYVLPHVAGLTLDEFDSSKRHAEYVIDTVEAAVSTHAAAKAYRVLRSAMSDGVRAELVDRNVVKLVREPVPVQAESEYLTPDDGRAVLAEVLKLGRYRARWLMALTMGERQSQCLGLRWHDPAHPRLPGDVDLGDGVVYIRKKLLRRTWSHGCGDPQACGAAPRPGKPAGVHRLARERCPGTGPKHDRYHLRGAGCPPPVTACPAHCAGHAAACPKRHGGGLVLEDPKTRAGIRSVPMPAVTLEAFRLEKRLQDEARLLAGSYWRDTGLCFTTDLGTALDPRNDHEAWKQLLARAGVEPAKLHSARHFARIILGILRVPTAVVKQILGWATDMSHVYDHAPDDEMRAAMNKVNDHLFGDKPGRPRPPRQGRTRAGSSTDLSTGRHLRLVK